MVKTPFFEYLNQELTTIKQICKVCGRYYKDEACCSYKKITSSMFKRLKLVKYRAKRTVSLHTSLSHISKPLFDLSSFLPTYNNEALRTIDTLLIAFIRVMIKKSLTETHKESVMLTPLHLLEAIFKDKKLHFLLDN